MRIYSILLVLVVLVAISIFLVGCDMGEFFNIFSPNVETPPPTIAVTHTPHPTATPTPRPTPSPTPVSSCGGCGGGTCPYSY